MHKPIKSHRRRANSPARAEMLRARRQEQLSRRAGLSGNNPAVGFKATKYGARFIAQTQLVASRVAYRRALALAKASAQAMPPL